MDQYRIYLYAIIQTMYIAVIFHIEYINKMYLIFAPIIFTLSHYAYHYGDSKTNIILIIETLFSLLFRSYIGTIQNIGKNNYTKFNSELPERLKN